MDGVKAEAGMCTGGRRQQRELKANVLMVRQWWHSLLCVVKREYNRMGNLEIKEREGGRGGRERRDCLHFWREIQGQGTGIW